MLYVALYCPGESTQHQSSCQNQVSKQLGKFHNLKVCNANRLPLSAGNFLNNNNLYENVLHPRLKKGELN